MDQLFPIIRRKRRPLVIEPAPVKPEAEKFTPPPDEIPKPKKLRDDVAKN